MIDIQERHSKEWNRTAQYNPETELMSKVIFGSHGIILFRNQDFKSNILQWDAKPPLIINNYIL